VNFPALLDIEMPVMDGITAARSIRRMGGPAAATPLMALSAFLADSVRTGDWRDTFDIALPKPANRNELHEAVKSALARTPAEPPPSEHLPPLIDEAELRQMRGPDWRHFSDRACRAIETCLGQLEEGRAAQKDGAMLVSAAKLGSLGRDMAARRIDWAAQKVQLLGLLITSARDTVEILRG